MKATFSFKYLLQIVAIACFIIQVIFFINFFCPYKAGVDPGRGGGGGGRGRRDGDVFEVRAGVGDCVASPRALTAHGASIIAISKWVGRSNMALPSFRSNAIVTLRAR